VGENQKSLQNIGVSSILSKRVYTFFSFTRLSAQCYYGVVAMQSMKVKKRRYKGPTENTGTALGTVPVPYNSASTS
jgi:hypothetical protein